jgi:hypothetical protein
VAAWLQPEAAGLAGWNTIQGYKVWACFLSNFGHYQPISSPVLLLYQFILFNTRSSCVNSAAVSRFVESVVLCFIQKIIKTLWYSWRLEHKNLVD